MSSYRLAIIFALLLLAGRAAGQTDTCLLNYEILGGTFNWTVQTTFMPCPKPSNTYTGIIPLNLSYFGHAVLHGDTISLPQQSAVRFVVDTMQHRITHFTISGLGTPTQGFSQFSSSCTLAFDPIVYDMDSTSSLRVASGSYHATAHTDVSFLNLPTPDSGCRGESETGHFDSTWASDYGLVLWISPIPKSGVQDAAIHDRTPLHIAVSGKNLEVTSSSSGRLIVMDLLGRTEMSQEIPIARSGLQISIRSLPPGCYFARLGTEVAKFCVVE
ncbi:MAG: hypothetical protein Q8922_00450 [Bacteroidota bacterium]|nr:hypothetical protein [Bacteroidota bacterium]MDP4232503.1 hypothetical protein [Bacteroidota bacterium]MDP4241638.1 hypothetical protein [Bacteroidota bacterium]MDP4286383.1 hypothetical protein [Bacteroidota bacterium]